MKNRPIALSLSLALAAAFAPSAPAQRRGSAPAGRAASRIERGGVRAGFARPRGVGRNLAGSGYGYTPYFGDYYPDYGSAYDTPLAQEPPPQMAGVEAASAVPATPAKPSEALVLELQGDHWVRITPYGLPQTVSQTVGQAAAPQPQIASNAPAAKALAAHGPTPAAKPPATPLPPAVLVFRDGHQEEIGQYRIMGATIYLNTDYWTSGAWTRTVPIADLDVPATLKLNQQRGANFRLPSGPNEVMIGG